VLRRSGWIAPVALVVVAMVGLVFGAALNRIEITVMGAAVLAGPWVAKAAWVRSSDVAVTAWLSLVGLAAGLLGLHPELSVLASLVLVGVASASAWVLPDLFHGSISTLCVSLAGAGWIARGARPNEVTPIMLIGAFALILRVAVKSLRFDQLTQRKLQRDLIREGIASRRLYSVASAIGAASTAEEVIPDLLAALTETLEARSGAVVLADRSSSTMRLVGPVWVSGCRIAVDEPVVERIDDSGLLSRILRSPRAIVVDGGSKTSSPILRDLGMSQAVVAPLRLEGRAIGLIIVGDPVAEEFDANAGADLTTLAGPAALVLAQVERHEQAALLNRRLQEIADMKSDFVSMVSHELRTPLTSVLGALETLTRPDLAHPNPAAGEMTSAARRQALRLKRLIDDLLIISRIDRGVMSAERHPVCLARVVDEAIGLVGRERVSRTVPADVYALGDSDQIAQILTNLIENACKYSEGSTIEIFVSAAADRVRFAVVDHGPGIDEADRERVFERFVRLPGSQPTAGTGLGLSIVKMLVEGMDGTITLEETPGGGATFQVTLPTAQSRDLALI
jgi:signal transduction histidine kinase